MPDRQRPHVAWTAAVIAALALLSVVAWRLWAGSEDPMDGGKSALEEPADVPTAMEEGPETRALLDAAIEEANGAVLEERFDLAREKLQEAEQRFGWSEELQAASSRLELSETSFQTGLRPIEFRIESFDTDLGDLYARFYVEGQLVFATETLVPNLTERERPAHGNIAVLRTSMNLGVSVELVEQGGLFSDDDVALGPLPINPLAEPMGGIFKFSFPDAPVRSCVVSYRISPHDPGLHLDAPLPPPPANAPPSELISAVERAVSLDQLEAAREAALELKTRYPDHLEDIDLVELNLNRRLASLQQNRTAATFTVLEMSVDPRADGETDTKLWNSGGSAPSFKSSIVRTTDAASLSKSGDDPTLSHIFPGTLPAEIPPGNQLEVRARGTEPLSLHVRDVSPRFSTRFVGSVDLPITLAELPKGTGTLVIERYPSVLVLPNSDPNRIRRVVLRWSVTR